MKNKTPHPERYYYASLICLILLFLNYYRTDGWTGDKPFSEFAGRDWQLLAIFFIDEIYDILSNLLDCDIMAAIWKSGEFYGNFEVKNAIVSHERECCYDNQ